MAPPGASSSSSHGSPLDQHPPFQAAQRRADAREKPLMEKTMTELLEDEGVFHVERGEQTAMVFSVEIPLPENKRDVKRFAKRQSVLGEWPYERQEQGLSSSGVRSRNTEFQIFSKRKQRSFRIG